MTKLAYSVAEAAAMISVSPKHLYNQIHIGRLKVSKVGSRTVITPDQLKKYLQDCQDNQSQPTIPSVRPISKADQLGLHNRKA